MKTEWQLMSTHTLKLVTDAFHMSWSSSGCVLSHLPTPVWRTGGSPSHYPRLFWAQVFTLYYLPLLVAFFCISGSLPSSVQRYQHLAGTIFSSTTLVITLAKTLNTHFSNTDMGTGENAQCPCHYRLATSHMIGQRHRTDR
jgi:hypothetical protein